MSNLLNRAVSFVGKRGSRAVSGASNIGVGTLIKDEVFAGRALSRANPLRSPRGTAKLGKGPRAVENWTGSGAHDTPSVVPFSYSPARGSAPAPKAQNWTRPGASTPGQWAPDAPKPWDPSQRGQMVHVPRPSSTPPINKVASTNSPIGPSGSVWGAAATGVVGGGLTANFFSSEENRGFGTFVKGSLFGLGGGLGMHMAMGSKIMSGTTGAIARAAKKGGNETAISWAGGAHRAAVMAQSQQSRAAAWSAGALLAGGMGGSGKSKAHGMNANRGNRFGG